MINAIAFALAAILFTSISCALVCCAIAATLIYSHERFLFDIRETTIHSKRNILEDISFADMPVSVKLEIMNNGSRPLKGTFEDMIPENIKISSGKNKLYSFLPGQKKLILYYSFITDRRGDYTIDGLKINRIDDFNIFKEIQIIENKTIIEIQTKKESIEIARKLAAKEHFEYSGVARNIALVMQDFEFDSIRDYAPGDRTKDIHWKLLSKLDKLMIKIFKKEGTIETIILLDCSRSMRLCNNLISKLDQTIDFSIQLSNLIISNFQSVGIVLADEVKKISEVSPAYGKYQLKRIIRTLQKAPSNIEERFSIHRKNIPDVNNDTTNKEIGNNDVKTRRNIQNFESLNRLDAAVDFSSGIEIVMKNILTRSRKKKQLFIVMTDLISSRDAVLTIAKMCNHTQNRMLIIHTYDDWYIESNYQIDYDHAERLYNNISKNIAIEAIFKNLGVSYFRIGPGDITSRITKRIRKESI